MSGWKSIIPIRLLLGLALLVLGGVAGLWFVSDRFSHGAGDILPRHQVDEKVTLSILRSEAMTFLVTRRVATQIVIEHTESDWLGDWRGVLWATVSWRWGVDLQKLTEKDLRREGDQIVCRLPEPELLDFGIEPGSENFMSKSTAVPKLREFFRAEQQKKLHDRIREAAMKFADDQKLRPSRQEMVEQLNKLTDSIRQGTGQSVRFE